MVTMEWSKYLLVRHDLQGPFQVDFLREGSDLCFFDVVGREIRTFALRLTAENGEVVIFRRYEQLQKFARATATEGLGLPARGVGYLFSRERRERAAEELVHHVAAALQEDPLAEGAALRDFLALEAAAPKLRQRQRTSSTGLEGLCDTQASSYLETGDTCSADVVGWSHPSTRGCLCLSSVMFEVQVNIFSDGEVLSHSVHCSLAQARELHRALVAEGLAVDAPSASSVGFFSAAAVDRQQRALGAFLRQCTLMDVHLRSESLRAFFGVALDLEDPDGDRGDAASDCNDGELRRKCNGEAASAEDCRDALDDASLSA